MRAGQWTSNIFFALARALAILCARISQIALTICFFALVGYATDANAIGVSSVTSSTANGSYGLGQTITVQVIFNGTVYVDTSGGTPTLTLETGSSDAVVSYSSGSGSTTLVFDYTVQAGHNSADLNYTAPSALALNGGTIKDGSNANASLTLPGLGSANSLAGGKALVVDTLAPTVSITSSASSATKTSPIPVTITFSEAVTGFVSGDITLSNGTVTSFSGSGASYTVNVAPLSEGVVTLDVQAGVASDATGNLNSAASQLSRTYDSIAPTVTNVTSTSSDGAYRLGQTINIRVTMSEAVTVTGTPQITLETGSSDAVVSYSGVTGSPVTDLDFTYTVVSGNASGDLDYTATTALALNGGSIADAATNSATLTLPSPGAANSLGANKSILVDGVVPTVTGVTSSSANGYYRAGDSVSIQISFSEAVTVTGTPTLTLETGSTDAVVNYSSGSGTTVLTFNYTVASGHSSSDLDCQSTSALSGTIKDANGNSATLTLPLGATSGSLAANKAIVVDAVVPTVSSVNSSTANGSYKAGQAISLQVNFSEAVTVTGSPTLTLETGASDAVVNYVSGSGTSSLTFTYTISSGETSADLDCQSSSALSLNGGTITDVAGNNATLTVATGSGTANSLANNKALVVDTTAPTITNVTSSTANGSYRAGQSVSIRVTFSEAVTVTGTPQLTLETGASDAVVNYASGTGTSTLTFTYSITAGHTASDLDYISTSALALNSGTIRDAATNNATLTLPSPGAAGSLGSNKDIIVDTTSPSITLSTSSSSPTSSYPITVSITFPESVTGLTASDFTVVNGCAYNLVGSGASYTIDVAPTTIGFVDITLPAGRVTDTAGNSNTASSSLSVDFQTSAPRITSVTSSPSSGSYKAGQSISVEVNFSSAVSVTGTPQIILETGTSDAVVNYSGGSGTTTLTFNYTIQAGHTSSDLDYRVYTTSSPFSLNSGTIKDSATGTLDAALLLACPGAAGSLGANSAVVVDTTAPSVSSVNSSTLNGSYKAAQAISIQVNFSEAVTVTGTPTLTLETGATDAVVNYTSGSGTTALTFTYTVGAGQNSSDLDCQSANALSVNGGSIKDAAGNDATLTLAVGAGTANSLANNKALVIDTIAPTVSNVTSSTANGSFKAGDTIGVQVVFSEIVAVSGGSGANVSVTLNTGGVTTVNYTSGTGTSTLLFNYTIASGDSSSDLAYTSTSALSNGGRNIRDNAGNDAVLTLATPGATGSLDFNKNLVVDTTAPTVLSVTTTMASGTYKVGSPTIPITVNFSESVTVSGTPRLQLGVGGTTYATYSSGSGTSAIVFNYTIASGNTTSDLDYSSTSALGLNAGTIRDAALNDATLTLPTPGASGSISNTKDIVIDTTSPSVTSITSTTADGYYKEGSAIDLVVNFDEAVVVTGTPKLTLETGATDGVATYTGGTGTTALTFRYTVGAGESSSDLEVQSSSALSANGGTMRDAVGNDATLTLTLPTFSSTRAIVVDTTAPTVSVSVAQPSITNVSPLAYTITFSEQVTGFLVGDLSIQNGVPSNFTQTSTTTFTVDVTPSGEGVVEVSVGQSVAEDLAQNPNAMSNTSTITYDSIRPTVTVSSSAPPQTGTSPIPVSIDFDEIVVGFTNQDITVINGTVSNFSGSGSNYTVNIVPSGQGPVQVSVAAGIAQDSAGNPNVGSNTLTRTYDTVSPTVNLTTTTPNATNQAPLPVTITFSESVTGFVVGEVSVSNGTASNFVAVNGTTYTVDIAPSGEGVVQVGVASGVAGDAAGNQNTASEALSVMYDITSPTVDVSSTAPSITNSSPIPVRITFSEPTSNFAIGDITVTNGTTSNLSGSGTSYTVDITPTGDGIVEISLASGVASDAAGNSNGASATLSRRFDTTSPVPSLSTTIGATTNQSPFAVTIVFNEPVTGLSPADLNIQNGTASNLTGSGTSYAIEITPSGEGIVTVSLPAGSAADSAGNNSETSNEVSVIYDLGSPTVTVTSGAPSPTKISPIPFTITFSEVPTGFTASDVTVTNGSVTSFSGSGVARNITVTPSGQGIVEVLVGAGVATDAAGNGNIASNSVGRVYDSVAPDAPVISTPSEGSLLLINQPSISGTAEASATITVKEGGSAICSTTVGGDGSWSCSPTSPLAEGRHALAGFVVDPAGNSSSSSSLRNIVIDAVELGAPTVDPSVSEITSDVTPPAFGNGPAGMLLHVREGEVTLCTTTITGGGSWSCNLSQLSTGSHNLVAWAHDPSDDTVSDDVPFTVLVGVSYRGIVAMADRGATPLEGVVVSYQTASTTSDESGAFELPVPDELGVSPILSKRGWAISPMASDGVGEGIVRYSAVPSLESKSYAIWDAPSAGFVQNLKLLNKGSSVQNFSWSLIASSGDICDASTATAVSMLGDYRTNLTANACLAPTTFGLIEVVNEDGLYDGEFESSVPGANDRDLKTSALSSLSNSILGSSYLMFDTSAAVLKADTDLQFTENALLIANVSEDEHTFTVRYRNGNGIVAQTKTLLVPGRATVRSVLGLPGQKRSARGLVEIEPDDDQFEYVATMRRYGFKYKFNVKKKIFEKNKSFFVMSEYARTGTGRERKVRYEYSNPLDGANYIELGNTTGSPVTVSINHVGQEIQKIPSGSRRPPRKGQARPPKIITKNTTITVGLPGYGSSRVLFSKFIKTSTEGVVTITTNQPDSVLANIVSHQYNSSGNLNASSLFPLEEVFGDDQYGFYESNPASSLWLSNSSSLDAVVNIECLVSGSALNIVPLTISPRSSAVAKLATCFGGAASGVVHLNSSITGGVVGDRIRARSTKGFKARARLH